MLINDRDAMSRLNSPMNLINKLKSESPRKSAMSLFIRPSAEKKSEIKPSVSTPQLEKSFNPFSSSLVSNPLVKNPLTPKEEPTIDNLIENSDTQVKLALAHDKALELLNNSVLALASKLDDVKADKLPSVITAASKVVEGIRKERREIASENEREVHYHFYTPQQRKLSDFVTIDVA